MSLIADEIISMYIKHGSEDYIGEDISQISHMIQCGMNAEQETGDPEHILAGFLHDIGHFLDNESMNGYGIVDHEFIGAKYLLEKGFSDKICKMVENHVSAKRFLCSTNPDYYDTLSNASKETFKLQGGYLTEEEIEKYMEDPLYKEYCMLRKWDDAAKKKDIELKSLDFYKNLIIEHLDNNLNIN